MINYNDAGGSSFVEAGFDLKVRFWCCNNAYLQDGVLYFFLLWIVMWSLVHINDTLNKSYFSLLIWLQTAIEQKHEERFPQHKKSHKACNWKWWEPCFSFVLLVYNESFSRSFILVEEEILLELFISKIHSLEPYHILDQIKNYLDSSHHNELPKTKLVMMTGHIILKWFLNRILLSRDS